VLRDGDAGKIARPSRVQDVMAQRMPRLLLCGLVAIGLASAPSAWGDETSVQDPQGDSVYCGAPTDPCPPELDITSIGSGHSGIGEPPGWLKHTIVLNAPSQSQFPQLEIYITSTTIGRPDFYTVAGQGGLFDANGDRGDGGGITFGSTPDFTTWFVYVDPQRIGNPPAYRWRAILPGETVGPNGPADPAKIHDAAPDAPNLATHSLSRGGGASQPLPAPSIGRTVNVTVRSGVVLVKRPGARSFTRLQGAAQIPIRSFLDTTRGRVGLTSAVNAQGGTQSADFYSGQFQVLQSRTTALTELRLSAALGPCPRASTSRVRRRRLWGRGRGRFRTRGRYGAATVRGTTWLTQDTCSSTQTRVTEGQIAFRDFVRRRTIILRAGQSYTARPRP
jgi:hypothetical protein